MAAAIDSGDPEDSNVGSQLVRLWLTFHQMMVNRTAQMNTTMSRQLPR